MDDGKQQAWYTSGRPQMSLKHGSKADLRIAVLHMRWRDLTCSANMQLGWEVHRTCFASSSTGRDTHGKAWYASGCLQMSLINGSKTDGKHATLHFRWCERSVAASPAQPSCTHAGRPNKLASNHQALDDWHVARHGTPADGCKCLRYVVAKQKSEAHRHPR